MAISEVDTQTATTGNGTSVTVTKPSGTAQNDLLLAFFTSNSQNCTPPTGFTEISDDVTEVFRMQIFYKIAGSSEPSNYTFSVNSDAPIVCSVVALRGIDTSDPIDIDPEVNATTGNQAEPYTSPSVSGGDGGRLVFFRAARRKNTTPISFTGAAATEMSDVGVGASTISYSHATYLASSEYATSGSKSGLAITASATESHNIIGTIGIRSVALPATLDVEMLLPQMDMAGNPAIPGQVDVSIPIPEMRADVWVGDYEGTLDVTVPISMDFEAATPPAGDLDVQIPIAFSVLGETRKFNENVVTPDRDERWIIVTPDGYVNGRRQIVYLPLRIELPLIRVNIAGDVPPFGFPPPPIPVEAFEPAMFELEHHEQAEVSATATAYGAAMLPGEIPNAGAVSASIAANPASVHVKPSAGEVSVSGVAYDAAGVQVLVEDVDATVTANNPTVLTGKLALAGHVSVTCHN
jgi:hypothetical protein